MIEMNPCVCTCDSCMSVRACGSIRMQALTFQCCQQGEELLLKADYFLTPLSLLKQVSFSEAIRNNS